MNTSKIKDISTNKILSENEINSKFKNITFDKIKLRASIYTGDFIIDSFNYFPITTDNYYSFPDQFDWQGKKQMFFSKEFEKNYFSKSFKINKEIENAYVLGSSPGNNYYRNIFTFLYRLFFITDSEINLAIHRNTSNNIKNHIRHILDLKKIKINKFIYLDDGFYLFKNSQIPCFLNLKDVMILYENNFQSNKSKNKRIYISRRNAEWRKVVNETTLYSDLEKNGFAIIDLESKRIDDQINFIQSANKIISPHGSGLVNLIFSSPETSVVEIMPKNIENEIKHLYSKYKQISILKKNKHLFFGADLVDNTFAINTKMQSYISMDILKNSTYYKNFIVQEKEFKNLIINFCKN